MSWLVVTLIQYINWCHSENVHLKTNFKRGWQEKWLVRKQLCLSFFVGFVWYGESREREWPTAELVSYIFAWFTYFNMQCVQREIRKGFCYWVLLGILYAIVWMRSINWTSRRSQGYPLLAAGLLIPTRRKLRLCWYLQKKPVKVCIRSSYREYPPLKPKKKIKKKMYLLRPFVPSVLKAFLAKVLWRFQGGLPQQNARRFSSFNLHGPLGSTGEPTGADLQVFYLAPRKLHSC